MTTPTVPPRQSNSDGPESGVEAGFDVLDLFVVLLDHFRLLAGLPIVAGVIAMAVVFSMPPTFTASTRILTPQPANSIANVSGQLGAIAAATGISGGIRNPIDTYVVMLKSRSVADRLISRFELKSKFSTDQVENLRQILSARTRIVTDKGGVIAIEVDDRDPKLAADLANGYVEALRELTQTLAVTEAGQRRLFFEEQLKRAKKDLTEAEIALRSGGVGEGAIRYSPQTALDSIVKLKAQISSQEVRLASLRGQMTEANPEYARLQSQIQALRSQLGKEESGAGQVAGSNAGYIGRFRDFKYQEAMFELLTRQYELARLDESREGAVVQVIDVAQPPEKRSKPKRAQIVIFVALATLLLVLVWIFIRRALLAMSARADSRDKILRIKRGFSLIRR